MVPVRPERMYCGTLRTTFKRGRAGGHDLESARGRHRLGALLDAQGVVAGGRPGQVEGGEHLARADEVDGRGVDGGAAEVRLAVAAA